MTTDVVIVHCFPYRQALICELWVVTWCFCIVLAILGHALLILGGGQLFCVVVSDGGGQGG